VTTRQAANQAVHALRPGMVVTSDLTGTLREYVIQDVDKDPRCGSGLRVQVERPKPCVTCGRLPLWAEEFPQLYARVTPGIGPGVDAAWFQPKAPA
jgi:hypothetical protein